MRRLTDLILGLSGVPAYVLIFSLAALESAAFIGLVFPGELVVLLGGVLAFQGRISLPVAAGVAIAGAIVGDSVGYATGARWGEAIFSSRIGRRIVKPRHRARAEEYLRRRGGSAVLLGRFTTALRVLVPGLAGMARMRYRTFLLYNVLGGLLWAGGFTLLGYAAGSAWKTVERFAARASLFVALLVLLVVAAVVAGRWLVRHEAVVRTWWGRQIERPRVAAFRRRYDRQLAFVRQRFEPGGALGLYLTIGLGLTVALAWSFLGALQDLVAKDGLALLDAPVARFVRAHRSPEVTGWMQGIATALRPSVVLGVAAVTALVAARRERSLRPAAFIAACAGGAYPLEGLIRWTVDRIRPGALAGAVAGGFSTVNVVVAVALFGGLALLVSRATNWHRRVWAWVSAALGTAVVTTAGVYLSVGRFSEMVAGAALGATWLGACSVLLLAWERLERAATAGGTGPLPQGVTSASQNRWEAGG